MTITCEATCPHCGAENYNYLYKRRGGTCCDCGEGFAWSAPKPARPSWDDYFFDLARSVSTRATCPRASIGVVIVSKDHHVISTGFNGAPSGEPHCTDVGCEIFANHCVRARHAERNSIDGALKVMATVAAWDAVSTSDPSYTYRELLTKLEPTAYIVGPRDVCSECARVLFLAGVKEVKVRP